MSVAKRDKYSGHMTTGHEWNGIEELNTPVPLVLIVFLLLAFLFAVGYWIFMPAWPLGDTYTRGTLRFDQRKHLEKQIIENNGDRSYWTTPLERLEFSAIRDNPQLMDIAQDSGPALFKDNCAMCHGNQGGGGLYFPKLNDESWLWGSEPESVLKTLTVGINSNHPDSHLAVMPPFGDAGVLSADTIDNLVLFVQSMSDSELTIDAESQEKGKKTYSLYCAGCHGLDGGGSTNMGAPNLKDNFWIYGGDSDALTRTLNTGRQGHMPAWEKRLSLSERKILTLYVLSLGQDTDTETETETETETDSQP